MTTGENNTKELAIFSIKDHKIMTQFKDVQSFTIKNADKPNFSVCLCFLFFLYSLFIKYYL